MASTARALAEDVLPKDMIKEIWSGNYFKALPISVLDFELSAVLPAVFYMFRFGRRRGSGEFLNTFGDGGTTAQRRRAATVERIAGRLADAEALHGFKGDVERAILGDLLLCFCVENTRRELGRDKQIQRVAPAHYMASWVDVPDSVAHLRYVPEMIVAMLANQRGADVRSSTEEDRTRFPVGLGYEDNLLLRAFSQGVTRQGVAGDLAADRFDEMDDSVGLDQLLMIRFAQQLRRAPARIKGQEGAISNQRPVAEQAARNFCDDIRKFVRSYANVAPRQALVEMLESCVAVGLTTILTSTVEVLFAWEKTGMVPDRAEQHPEALFVDCSDGVDREIGSVAEQSMDDLVRRMERIPVVLMALRLLDYEARDVRSIRNQDVPTRPYATTWLNLMGDLLHGRHSDAQRVLDRIDGNAEKLAMKLVADYPDAAAILDDAAGLPNPVWRLAEGVMALIGRKWGRRNFMKMMDSGLLTGRPNGLATKRTTTRGGGVTRRRRDVRSLVFTDSVLDYLVHLHLLPGDGGGRDANMRSFLDFVRDRYGFHVATAPPGTSLSNQLLQRNRSVLERRLRDLGLLVGVNDAEAMKRLRPRFERFEYEGNI